MSKTLSRVLAFGWLALKKSILTIDNLHRRKMIVVNACPLYLLVKESVGHLLLNCKLANRTWKSILNSFDCSWSLPKSISNLFASWRLLIWLTKGRIMWRSSCFSVIWAIWKEKNWRCFEGKVSPTSQIIASLRLNVVSWVFPYL